MQPGESPPERLLPAGSEPAWLPGRTEVQVVGEIFHAEAITATLVAAEPPGQLAATLMPEPGNPHDSNAVAVYLNGALAGHLPRDVAAHVKPARNRPQGRMCPKLPPPPGS